MTSRGPAVLAKPPVRKLAKTLGVDLAGVPATGPNGTVSRADVEAAANGNTAAAPSPGPREPGARETRIPIKGVRKHTAEAMVASAFTAPHVTEFVTVDVSEMMALRDRVAERREFRDVKVSPLLFVAKAVLLAAQRTPEINASWDAAAGEIVLKHYVNLGIAAAGAIRRLPWVVDEQIVPRWVTQLAVSFDHRIVDGQQGSQFLADVAQVLHDPGLALL